MSLILAIEPDRRQVAHLTSIVRHVKGADLVLADTTERALESIGNNIPDLILVPALLSPQDDAALAAALRVIASAAHVQMLTIPTFAAPKPKRRVGGMLSAFRRKQDDDEPLEGCDPRVFADEIASYLERANEERAAAQFYDTDQRTVESERNSSSASAFAGAFDKVSETPTNPEPEIEMGFEAPIQPEAVSAEETEHDVPAAGAHFDAPSEPPLESLVVAQEPEHEPAVIEANAPTFETAFPVYRAEELPREIAATPPETAEPMALDEFATTLEHVEPAAAPIVEHERPLAAAKHPADDVPVSEFEDLLADFERANLPTFEEVHADSWMLDAQDDEPHHEDVDDQDIDLSVELDAVLGAADAPPHHSLSEPKGPSLPAEGPPHASWQGWPPLDRAAQEQAAAGNGNGNGNGHGNGNGNGHKRIEPDASLLAEFVHADFEEQQVEAADDTQLEPFEPVVPLERFEPMPLAGWMAWPRIEGAEAEVYQEPIAPRKPAAKPEWVELMRSLREDIARRRAELAASGPVEPPKEKPRRPLSAVAARIRAGKPAPAPAPAPIAPPPANAHADADADADNKRPKRTRPIEDEWGLFDPEQCGFAALLDKLDEITVATAARQQTRRQSR
jgi:hypothetical protein